MLKKIRKILPKSGTPHSLSHVAKQHMGQTATPLYISQMYQAWMKDKSSVDRVWNEYFTTTGFRPGQDIVLDANSLENLRKDTLKIYHLIRSYQQSGHEIADLDPLKLDKVDQEQSGSKSRVTKDLSLDNYNLTEKDLDRYFPLNNKYIAWFLQNKPVWTLGEIIHKLERIYCGKIGFEYLHIPEGSQRRWLKERIEKLGSENMTKTREQKLLTFRRLCENHTFNTFLQSKYSATKRFGVEGCDTLISGLKTLVDEAAKSKIEHVVFGMAHRGRLNTLALVLYKPAEVIFAEFQDLVNKGKEEEGFAGDVKYHLGATHDKTYADGHTMRLSILPNPSHLETVNPVVLGKVKAIQEFQKDDRGDRTMSVLIHGDAAMAGQGIVYEVLQAESIPKFKVGGTVHIIVNNQIGFTTVPKDGRTGLYCTDVAKVVGAPIFHVNADDPEAVETAIELALEYRQNFREDVVVDIIGYRKFGHNELDQPLFTQPLMYKKIALQKPVYEKYCDELLKAGILTPEIKAQTENEFNVKLEEALNKSRTITFKRLDWVPKTWEQILPISPEEGGKVKDTGIKIQKLRDLGAEVCNLKANISIHPKMKEVYGNRAAALKEGKAIDFPLAESLAFSSLVKEGFSVRVSGQDVERGLLIERYAGIHNQEKNEVYYPLHNILEEGEKVRVNFCNSPMSEYSNLGYEYGYSLENPNCLTIWESHQGEFANNAQIIIDNYLVSSETKWKITCGLVLNLGHKMDGEGPENSSGRIERFLQLMEEDANVLKAGREKRLKKQIATSNMQIINCSTSANYFHALRRQLRRNFRKPLINFISKRTVKEPLAFSPLEDFDFTLRFKRVIPEAYQGEIDAANQIKRVIICSGQFYYNMLSERRALKDRSTVIVRIEQIAPFPYDELKSAISVYKNAVFIWAQEEHQNQGAWSFVEPRLEKLLEEMKVEGSTLNDSLEYAGRRPSATSAVGSKKLYLKQEEEILNRIFNEIRV